MYPGDTLARKAMIAQRALAAHRQMVYPKDALISSETYDCSKSITITELIELWSL